MHNRRGSEDAEYYSRGDREQADPLISNKAPSMDSATSDMPLLRYADLSMDAIKAFHVQYSALQVELEPSRGKLLRALLDQRSQLESALIVKVSNRHFLWIYSVFTFYEFRAYLFHRKLLLIEKYVKAVDAAHGYDLSRDGMYIFLLAPIAQNVWRNETPIQSSPESRRVANE